MSAYSVLAALEGNEVVDEATVEQLPESEEIRRAREAKEKKEKEAQAAAAKVAKLKQEIAQSREKQVPPKLNLPFDLIRRTRMCDDWLGSGRCPRGKECVFAHDVQEMNANRERVRRYQAEHYDKMGYKEYAAKLLGAAGARTTAHHATAAAQLGGGSSSGAGPSSSAHAAAAGGSGKGEYRQKGIMHPTFRPGGELYKTRLCRNYVAGRCTYGDHCTFAHGEGELWAHLKDPDAVEDELRRWGLQSKRRSSQQQRQNGAGPSSSTAAAAGSSSSMYDRTEGYGYIDSLYGVAPSTPPPPPPAHQAQHELDPAEMGARQMDQSQLEALMEGLDFSEEEEHPAFLCPITHERLRDPVVAADGYTYERAAIENWMHRVDTSPMTNMKLEDKLLIPNLTLLETMKIVLGDSWD